MPEVIVSQPQAPEPEPEQEPLEVIPYTGTETKFAYQMDGPIYSAGLQYNDDSSVVFTGSTYVDDDGTLLDYPQCYIAEFWPASPTFLFAVPPYEWYIEWTTAAI